MEANSNIEVTKQNPVFIASCNHFGYLERTLYKRWIIGNRTGYTWALNYTDAINELHSWIKDNEWAIKEYPKCTFDIFRIDGTLNKYQEISEEKVYSISAAKAKKLIL